MKRDDLIKLLLAEGETEPSEAQKAIIDQIMTWNGQDVEKAKGDADKLKSDLEAAQADAAAKQKQVDEANAQIEAFKGMDVEGVKKSADEWKAKAEQAAKDAAAQLAQVRFDHALERALNNAKALDAKSVRPHLNTDALKYDEKSDAVIGLEEQLKGIRESKAFLFASEQADAPPPPKATAGVTPPRQNDPMSFLEKTLKQAGLTPEKDK